MPQLLSIKQAASIAQVSPAHIRQAVHAKHLKAGRTGPGARAHYRIKESDLISWMDSFAR